MPPIATEIELPPLIHFLEKCCEHVSHASLFAEDAATNPPEEGISRADAIAILGRAAIARQHARLTLEEIGRLEVEVARW